MGSFIYFCEYCSAKLNVDDSWLGKSRECPACRKNITFPDAQTLGAEYDDDFPAAPDFSVDQAREKLQVSAPAADGIASEKSPVDTPNNIAAAAGQAVMLAGSQSSYFWGRLGSAAVYVLAVIALLFGIYLPTFADTVALSMGQSPNIYPISVALERTVTSVRLAQLQNAQLPTEVTPSGIVMLVSSVQ